MRSEVIIHQKQQHTFKGVLFNRDGNVSLPAVPFLPTRTQEKYDRQQNICNDRKQEWIKTEQRSTLKKTATKVNHPGERGVAAFRAKLCQRQRQQAHPTSRNCRSVQREMTTRQSIRRARHSGPVKQEKKKETKISNTLCCHFHFWKSTEQINSTSNGSYPQTTDMNLKQAHCLASRGPTLNL